MAMVQFRDLDAEKRELRTLRLDTSDGSVFDEQGNSVGRWEDRSDDNNKMLADYANDYALTLGARVVELSDPGRAAMMLSSRSFDPENPAIMMDAGGEDATLMDVAPVDVHIPSGMPNFASGYKNFMPLADAVLPVLTVSKQTDKYWQFQKEDAFQRAMPTVGAAGGAVAEIAPRLGNASYFCVERAVGGFVTTQVLSNADAPLKIEQAHVQRCMNVLLLEREIRAQALMRTSGNWNSTQVTTIAAGSQWNGGASSDPIKDLHALFEASYGDATGMLFPEPVLHAFQRNPAVRQYHTYKSSNAPMPNAQEIASILSLPPIYTSKMKFINSSGALAYVWGTDVIVFRQPDEMPPTNQEDVATAYTFRWNVADVKDGVSTGGWVVRRFYDPNRGSMGGTRIVVVHNDAEKFTSTFIGGLLINATQ